MAGPHPPVGAELREALRGLPAFKEDLPSFDSDAAPQHPAELYLEWLRDAIDAGARQPHAMTLSTVDPEGRPNSRVLILKGLDDGRWQFSTNESSTKGDEIASNPAAALCCYWSEVGRQVRLRGRMIEGGADESARDFRERPDGARAAALASPQSRPLRDPADLEAGFEAAREHLRSEPDLVSDSWVLFHFIPDEAEFWQADPDRRHIRLRYRLEGQRWSRQRLWP